LVHLGTLDFQLVWERFDNLPLALVGNSLLVPVDSFVEVLVGNFQWVHLRKLVSELGHTPVWAQFRNFAVGFADKIVWAPVYTPVWELSYTLVAQRVDSFPVGDLCKPVVVLESTLG